MAVIIEEAILDFIWMIYGTGGEFNKKTGIMKIFRISSAIWEI